jgi:hypothetical protein
MTWSKAYNNLSFASLQFRAGIYQVKKPGLCSLGQALTSKAYKKNLSFASLQFRAGIYFKLWSVNMVVKR